MINCAGMTSLRIIMHDCGHAVIVVDRKVNMLSLRHSTETPMT